MHSCICYCQSTCPQTVYISILRLSVWPFWGLVGKADSPTTVLTPAFWYWWHMPIEFYFSFTRCSPTPWMFALSGLSSVSDMDSLLMISFLMVLSIVQCLWRFWRGFRNGPVNFAVISTKYVLSGPQILLEVSALVAGLLFFWTLLSGGSCGLYILFPCVQGDPKFL